MGTSGDYKDDKDGIDYFVKIMAGKSGSEELQATLWQDFCNTMALLSFKAIIDSRKVEDGEDVNARNAAVDIVISEWRKRAMSLMTAQVNQYSEAKRSTLGKLMGDSIPDEETIKIKFSGAVKEIENTARKMLLA